MRALHARNCIQHRRETAIVDFDPVEIARPVFGHDVQIAAVASLWLHLSLLGTQAWTLWNRSRMKCDMAAHARLTLKGELD
jgi:hypothetical protein